MKRAVVIVLDGVGIGEMPDAANYGDEGSNTLVNIKKQYADINIPNLVSLGIGNIDGASLLGVCDKPKAAYGKIAEASKGKDTTTGHWEIAGLVIKEPFPTYLNGFPDEIIREFENKIGRKTLANYASSGTEIIDKLGDEHVKTGFPIVYTSADSVFQVAAHEDVIPVDKLYEICQIARDMLSVGRIIARPFIGSSNDYKRTKNRKDFSLKPYAKTTLDFIKESGKETACVGKIEDIFSGVGITQSVHTTSNIQGVDETIEYLNNVNSGLIFTNLVDFDMEYGHRNDVLGFKKALEQFDTRLPDIMEKLKEDDILFITADHGCDPTTISTDHSREYVPLLVYGKNIKPVNLHIQNTFANIGATILHYLDVSGDINGNSFLDAILL